MLLTRHGCFPRNGVFGKSKVEQQKLGKSAICRNDRCPEGRLQVVSSTCIGLRHPQCRIGPRFLEPFEGAMRGSPRAGVSARTVEPRRCSWHPQTAACCPGVRPSRRCGEFRSRRPWRASQRSAARAPAAHEQAAVANASEVAAPEQGSKNAADTAWLPRRRKAPHRFRPIVRSARMADFPQFLHSPRGKPR